MKQLEVLPYHTMGKVKYEKMGIDYVLADVPDATQQQAADAKQKIIEGMKRKRQEMKDAGEL